MLRWLLVAHSLHSGSNSSDTGDDGGKGRSGSGMAMAVLTDHGGPTTKFNSTNLKGSSLFRNYFSAAGFSTH